MRRQKEDELKKNDLYWAKRLQQQEEILKQTSLLLETEYKNTVSGRIIVRMDGPPSNFF